MCQKKGHDKKRKSLTLIHHHITYTRLTTGKGMKGTSFVALINAHLCMHGKLNCTRTHLSITMNDNRNKNAIEMSIQSKLSANERSKKILQSPKEKFLYSSTSFDIKENFIKSRNLQCESPFIPHKYMWGLLCITSALLKP